MSKIERRLIRLVTVQGVTFLLLASGVAQEAGAQGVTITPIFPAAGGLDVDGDRMDVKERAVVEAAIDWWEMIITAPAFAVTVDFKTVATLGATGSSQEKAYFLCISTDFAEVPAAGGNPGLPTNPADGPQNVEIALDVPWFVDPTPHVNDEYNGTANPAFFTAKPGGPADLKFDLLTCIKHELGHILGFVNFDFPGGACVNPYTRYCSRLAAVGPDPTVFVFAAGSPFAGTPNVILSDGTHIDPGQFPNDLMGEDVSKGTRAVQSQIDRKMLANAFGYTVDPTVHVPTVSEWGMIVMVLLALTAGTVVFARWRRPAPA